VTARRTCANVTLRAVREWAGVRRIGWTQFTHAYEAAFLTAVSRLLQAIFREGHAPHASLWQNDAGQWLFDLGREPMLRAGEWPAAVSTVRTDRISVEDRSG